MKYALNYYYDPKNAGPTEAELPDWFAFDDAMKSAGVHVQSEGFYSAENAKTVRIREGNVERASGGVDAVDVLAGYCIIEVESEEEALKWAQQIPTANYGVVEVRQVVEM